MSAFLIITLCTLIGVSAGWPFGFACGLLVNRRRPECGCDDMAICSATWRTEEDIAREVH